MTLDFSYSCHFSNMGWLQERCDGDIFWFPSHQIEAVKVQVKSDLLSCSVLNNAEGNWREADASGVAGTTGKRIPIFAIKLTVNTMFIIVCIFIPLVGHRGVMMEKFVVMLLEQVSCIFKECKLF